MPKRVKSLSRQVSGQGIAEAHVAAGIRQALDAIESWERDIDKEMESLLLFEAPPSAANENVLFNELEGQPEKMKGLTNFFLVKFCDSMQAVKNTFQREVAEGSLLFPL